MLATCRLPHRNIGQVHVVNQRLLFQCVTRRLRIGRQLRKGPQKIDVVMEYVKTKVKSSAVGWRAGGVKTHLRARKRNETNIS